MRIVIAAAVALLALPACNKDEAASGGAIAVAKKGPSPAPTRPVPVTGVKGAAPGSQPASQPAGAMPPGHPPVPGAAAAPAAAAAAAAPYAAAPTAPAAPAGAGGVVKGTISLADAVKGDIKAGSVLFIIVRKDAGEGQRGMLIAAKRIDVRGADQFPIAYEVSAADVMMQGTALEGAVRVEARVDQDGDALSKTPGDVTGDGPATTVGGGAADFTLDTRI